MEPTVNSQLGPIRLIPADCGSLPLIHVVELLTGGGAALENAETNGHGRAAQRDPR